jgi:hypothetical protein
MILTRTIKRHDLSPPLRVRLVSRATNLPIDLTSATGAVFIMSEQGATTPKINRVACTIESPATSGWLRYDWVSGDTDTSGTYRGEFEVMWGTNPETFPTESEMTIVVREDLG